MSCLLFRHRYDSISRARVNGFVPRQVIWMGERTRERFCRDSAGFNELCSEEFGHSLVNPLFNADPISGADGGAGSASLLESLLGATCGRPDCRFRRLLGIGAV